MIPLLLTVALFVGFWAVGLCGLRLLGADTQKLHVALTAPALGIAVTALVVFVPSWAGLAVSSYAVWLAIILAVVGAAIIGFGRPAIPRGALVIGAISLASIGIDGWPMASLGFRWIANANADMAYYSLSAQQLLHHGLIASIDWPGLIHGRDYATVLAVTHKQGLRPGSDLLLAFVSSLTGRAPYAIFMPLAFAFSMSLIAAVGALVAQRSERLGPAALAAGLLTISPLATYGVLQQLIAQEFGLALGVALFVFVLRPELYRDRLRLRADLIPISVLVAALILGYEELASTLGISYVIYVAVLIWRQELNIRVALRLWLGGIVLVLVLLNGYLPDLMSYLGQQITHGSSNSGHPPLFGYMLMPSALPTVLGFQQIDVLTSAPLLGFSIALAFVVLVGALGLAIRETARGSAVAAVLVGDALIAVYLVAQGADFGLLKLAMYVQPFLVAGLALLVGGLRPRFRLLAAGVLVVLAVVAISTQQLFVSGSRNPGSFRDASAADLLPTAAAAIHASKGPTVVVGDNPVFVELTALNGRGHSVFFLSRDPFTRFISSTPAGLVATAPASTQRLVKTDGPTLASFATGTPALGADSFEISRLGESALADRGCTLVTPTGQDEPFNRAHLPEGHRDLAVMPCASAGDLLAPIDSSLGESFYLPVNHHAVGVYQLEPDPFFRGHTMAAIGRDQLFEVLGASSAVRLEVSYTFSLVHDGVNAIPHSTVLGSGSAALPVAGTGSARVISPPVRPRIIAGHPYLLFDIGATPRVHYDRRRGLDALFGTSVPLDTRRLTGYIRDISLVSASQYAHLDPPLAVTGFPAGLANPSLQYSGVYEDGWVGAQSYFVLRGGPATVFRLRASVPPGAARHMIISINGRTVADSSVAPGAISVNIPVPASSRARDVQLRFEGILHLAAPDYRPAAALLSYVGFGRTTG